MPRFFRDFAVLAGGQVATRLIGIVAFAILARRLDPEGYGAVEYVVGFAALGALAIDCGLGTIGVRRIAAQREVLPAIANQIPATRALVALMVAPAIAIAVTVLGPAAASPALIWLYAASLVLTAFNQEWLLQSAEFMPQVAIAQMLRAFAFAAAVFVLVQGPSDLAMVGGAETIAVAAVAAYYVAVQHLRITPLRVAVSRAAMAALLKEGAALGLGRLAWAAAQFMPLFLVGSVVAGTALAWFAAASRLVTSAAALSYVYHSNLYPTLARAWAQGAGEYARLLTASFRVTAWLAIGCALLVTLAAEPLLELIYGGRFAAAGPTLAVLIWTVPVTILSGHARWSLIVAGANRSVLVAQLAELAVVTAIGALVVTVSADVGVAIAALAGSMCAWAVSHALARRAQAAPPPFAVALRPALLAIAIGAAAELLPSAPALRSIAAFVAFAVLAPWVDRALAGDFTTLARAREATRATTAAGRNY